MPRAHPPHLGRARHAPLSHIEQIIKLADTPAETTEADTENLLHEARHQMDQDSDTGEDTARDGEAG
ncbi:hypothetical protein [Roseococcus suduntuyensis]|uniref:Uncharacterized protein n=1 Tax=Roseococcus suduntuyensis TaxID=455361 RepID=A0A840A6L6_9PROT|nr:hypothetical protein [Roseococcus suduntuyensis]MBB3897159.1 hypothetical protein [Roseococcus suduntuyensis]